MENIFNRLYIESLNQRTEILFDSPFPIIGKDTQVFTMGSCFANNIGDKLLEDKISVSVNPFGTVYNAISIFDLLAMALGKQPLDETLYYFDGEAWQHHSFHSAFWNLDKNDLDKILNHLLEQYGNALRETDILMITFGTSVGYRLKDSGKWVNNCHKRPAKDFEKYMLSLQEMTEAFGKIYQLLKNENPKLQILLTLSPVRHTKDGLETNSVSKSLLRILCEQATQYQDVLYFPAYEMMLDELRDYSFYHDDLIHPNDRAVDYIYYKFGKQYFKVSYKIFWEKWQKVKMKLSHRPMRPGTKQHDKFLQDLKAELLALHSEVSLDRELAEIDLLMQKQ